MSVTTSARRILAGKMANLPEGELPEEFWNLIARYRSDLVNQGFAIMGNLEDAEEIAQETFCEALQEPEKLREARSLGAWLRTINHANALNRLREKKRQARKSSRMKIEAAGRELTTGGFSSIEVRESVAKAIEALPVELRDAVVLHYWEHLPYDKIAEQLGISPRTVRRQIHDAYLKLYESLKALAPHAGEPEPRQE